MTRPELIRTVLVGAMLATAQGCAALSDSLPNASTGLTAPLAGFASAEVPAPSLPLPDSADTPLAGDYQAESPDAELMQEAGPDALVEAAEKRKGKKSRSGAATEKAPPPDDVPAKQAAPPAAAAPAEKPQPAPAGVLAEKTALPKEKEAAEEFYDPFAKKGEAADEEGADPWEGFNSAMFEFNRKFDKYLLKPVAKVYDKVMPNALQKGISNFYYNNIHFGPRFINNLLQFKLKGAGIELSRLVINDVIGLAGFFDPATHWLGIDKPPQEDTGQTLGAYGVPPGPYLVLPLLPPFTVRDFFGYLLDFGANPVNYFLLPKIGRAHV